jgi:hypothetical protein
MSKKNKKPRWNQCKHCRKVFNVIGNDRKVFTYVKTPTYSASYGPLCISCFNSPDVSFNQILEYYTNKSLYPHEDFTEEQVDKMIDSLIEETKINPTFKGKYLALDREDKLKQLGI